MIERFLKQTKFTSEQDFKEHLEFIIPEDFNFAYDVMVSVRISLKVSTTG